MRTISVIAILAATACVSQGKYEKATRRLDTCEADRGKLERERAQREAAMSEKLAASEDELKELRRQRDAQKAELELAKKFQDKLKAMIDVGDIDVSVRRGRMVVGMSSQVLFPSGEHDLLDKGKDTLVKIGAVLKEVPDRRFIVAGHTDNQPIDKRKGTYEDNWDLSARRALVVTRFLVDQGVPPANLAAAGYGEHDPAHSNKTAAGRAKNRRIELVVEPTVPEIPKGGKPAH